MGLYLLIWGEASNVRFMPECLCYIFHNVRTHFLSVTISCARMYLQMNCDVFILFVSYFSARTNNSEL